jgi:hypothetical protein
MEKEMPACPECDKMIEVQDQSNTLSAFVDWLNENGYTICTLEETDGYPKEQFIPHREPYEKLFAKYFNIDLNKVEKERCALLEAIRANQ